MFTKAEHVKEIEKLSRQIRKLELKGKDTSKLKERMDELLND